jgi:predicted transcriptional regulator
MQKTAEREHARALREEGRSMNEIARLVGVSLSSVSCWVRDVPLTEDQTAALRRRMSENGRAAAAAGRRSAARKVRRTYQEHGRQLAREGRLMHIAGAMLYWAEGSKSRNTAQFVNSDPIMASFFVRFLRAEYDVPAEAFRVCCNLFADHLDRQRAIEQFWLEALGLPESCLTKSIVNVYSKYSKKKRQNRLPYGTVRVSVHSTRIVQSIYGSIQEYGDFERPEWLD